MTEGIPEWLSDADNLLFRTGEHADCDEAACMELVGVDEPSAVDVLFVTFTKSAGERLDAWKRHADAPPANVGIVSVEVSASSGDRSGDGGPPVRHVSDPSDLTGVGIAISEFLSRWDGDGNRTVVCFESLTALLQYADSNRVFQFCNEMTSKFEQAGASAHFHITPEAHEEQVLSVLSSLFDDRVNAVDLGHEPDAADSEGSTDTVGPDESVPPDGVDAPADPFEYASPEDADMEADDADVEADDTDVEADGVNAEADDSTAATVKTDASEPAESTGRSAENASADVVSSIIGGESDASDSGESAADDEPTDCDEPTDSDDATTSEATDQTDDPEATDDAGKTERTDAADAQAESTPRTDATSRSVDREEVQRRLQFIGPDATEKAEESTEPAESKGADDSSPERSTKQAFYQRTTATVVGVVVMVVLISVLTTAVPLPIGTDAPTDGGADVATTPTPEPVAATGANGTTTSTATATPAPTATPTPEPTSSTSDSSTSSSGSSFGGGSSSTATPTATPTPTPSPTPTPTETSDDGSLTDVISDSEDDSTL